MGLDRVRHCLRCDQRGGARDLLPGSRYSSRSQTAYLLANVGLLRLTETANSTLAAGSGGEGLFSRNVSHSIQEPAPPPNSARATADTLCYSPALSRVCPMPLRRGRGYTSTPPAAAWRTPTKSPHTTLTSLALHEERARTARKSIRRRREGAAAAPAARRRGRGSRGPPRLLDAAR